MGYKSENEALEQQFPTSKTFSESVEPLSRNRDSNITQNEHVYPICCWPKVAGDIMSGENEKAIEGYGVLNF